MLHPVIEAAGDGDLPAWAEMSPERRAHAARVAGLLSEWAEALGLAPEERVRWCAAGWLHDAVKSAPSAALASWVGVPLRDLPGPVLHGPAAAARLVRSGVEDVHLLLAIAYHTIGHPDFDALGVALYVADYLEPGRSTEPASRAALRARLPGELDEVAPIVAAERIEHTLKARRPLRDETVAFWNRLVGGGAAAGAADRLRAFRDALLRGD